MDVQISNPPRAGRDEFARLAERYRRELRVHCYRMLGSLQDAEDLVQDTLLRAWQRLETYEGRASFRAWLYKIATNACLDALEGRPKRTLPPAKFPPTNPQEPHAPPITEPIWLEPFPDELLAEPSEDPEANFRARESITLAFLAALQILPPRQRAVLILRDVLEWHASEVAALLNLTVSSVNSALHRARVTMAKHYRHTGLDALKIPERDENLRPLLDRYVHAWEAADLDELIALLKEDASFPMPPSPSWYRGRAAIRAFVSAAILHGDARGRWRLKPIHANGQPAFAWYQRNAASGMFHAFAIQVLTFDGEQIADITTFPNPPLFTLFQLPQLET